MELQPTAYCSQRKVVIDESGVYHAVYVSSGLLWYIKSTDIGTTWSPEKFGYPIKRVPTHVIQV